MPFSVEHWASTFINRHYHCHLGLTTRGNLGSCTCQLCLLPPFFFWVLVYHSCYCSGLASASASQSSRPRLSCLLQSFWQVLLSEFCARAALSAYWYIRWSPPLLLSPLHAFSGRGLTSVPVLFVGRIFALLVGADLVHEASRWLDQIWCARQAGGRPLGANRRARHMVGGTRQTREAGCRQARARVEPDISRMRPRSRPVPSSRIARAGIHFQVCRGNCPTRLMMAAGVALARS